MSASGLLTFWTNCEMTPRRGRIFIVKLGWRWSLWRFRSSRGAAFQHYWLWSTCRHRFSWTTWLDLCGQPRRCWRLRSPFQTGGQHPSSSSFRFLIFRHWKRPACPEIRYWFCLSNIFPFGPPFFYLILKLNECYHLASQPCSNPIIHISNCTRVRSVWPIWRRWKPTNNY